jgi:hypothetical protein
VHTLTDLFGISSEELARSDHADPQTAPSRPYATTETQLAAPPKAHQALLDPKGSAIFWIAAAAVLGLVLISGQVRVEAALGGRAGRR